MLSGSTQPAGARRAAAWLLPVGSISVLLFVMCAIVAVCAVLVKSFSKNFGTELVKRMHGAGS